MSPAISLDPYVALHAAIIEIHHALRGSLESVSAAIAKPDIVVQQALNAGGFLLGHHEAETTVLFATLREHGVLRSSDVAVLDACDRDHHDLHELCGRMLASSKAPHPNAFEIAALAKETLARFSAHIKEEELGLHPERLRTMIDAKGLRVLDERMNAFRARYAP